MKSPQILFVTGTDTGVGKTVFTTLATIYLRQRGLRVAALKPLCSGGREDARLLHAAAGKVLSLDEVNPWHFRAALAPVVAARQEGKRVRLRTVVARIRRAARGFDVVLVETVGVGQDQVAAREVVDTLVLLVTPHTGDEVQWEKAGLIEVADVVVVNKSDLPGADRVRQQLEHALSLGSTGPQAPVLSVTAATGEGVAALWQTIATRFHSERTP